MSFIHKINTLRKVLGIDEHFQRGKKFLFSKSLYP